MRKHRVQIIHTYLTTAYPFAAIAAQLARVPIQIVSERASRRPIWPKRAWLLRRLIPHAHCIEINAHTAYDILVQDEKIDPARIVFHRNAVQPAFLNPLLAAPDEAWVQPGRIRIGTVANIHPYKNLLLLAQAIADLRADHQQVDAVHVGQAFLQEGEAAAAELMGFVQAHLDGHWIALGARDDVPAVLRALDIFVLTSDFEGTPNAMLEAMASGIPVVTTDVGDARVILAESGGGIVVPIGDRAALTGALRRLVDDPDLRRCMGQANRQWALANLSPERLTQQVETMYESLVQSALRK